VVPPVAAAGGVDDEGVDVEEHAAAKAATSSATASLVHVCLPRDVSLCFMGHSPRFRLVLVGC
jgi:hypothetical protein